MAEERGPGGKLNRSPRMNNVPKDDADDQTTEIETQLAGSGRTGVAPHESLIGAHEDRFAHDADRAGSDDDLPRSREPFGRGADVAPTERAEERERIRHQRQRAQGVVPAGSEGNPRQQRPDDVDREALDAAADDADRAVDGDDK
jgi:hypothetical protein